MTEAQRTELALDLEQEITQFLRSRQIRLDGPMAVRVEFVAVLIAEIATSKQVDTPVASR